MTTQTAYPDDTCDQYRALKSIWGDDEPINPEDIYIPPNPTMVRIKPTKQVSQPIFYIRLNNLESMREGTT